MGWGPWRLLQPHPTGRMFQHHSLDTEAHTASAWNAAPSPSEGPLSLQGQPHLLQEALLDQPILSFLPQPCPRPSRPVMTALQCLFTVNSSGLTALCLPDDALDRAEVGPQHLACSGCSTHTY